MSVGSGTESVCPGCGLTMPADERAVFDGYYNCSPECWSVYAEALEPEFSDPYLYGRVHQLTVDAYAVQHVGGEHPDKSVAIHLTGLHLVLERGLQPARLPPLFQELADRLETWPHFEPPARGTSSTVLDLALADSRDEHVRRARVWARGVWVAWSDHHQEVQALASRNLDLKEGMRSGTLWRLNVAFYLLYGLGVALTWSDLPGRIPMHFGLDGQADRWTERAGLIWFGLPALAAFLAVFIRTLGRLAARNPEIWNVPRKEIFLRMSPDQRAPVVESLEGYLAGTSLATGCLFAALQAGVYTTETGRSDGLSSWFMVVSVATVVGILIGAFLLRRRIARQIREAERMVSRDGSG